MSKLSGLVSVLSLVVQEAGRSKRLAGSSPPLAAGKKPTVAGLSHPTRVCSAGQGTASWVQSCHAWGWHSGSGCLHAAEGSWDLRMPCGVHWLEIRAVLLGDLP